LEYSACLRSCNYRFGTLDVERPRRSTFFFEEQRYGPTNATKIGGINIQ
jgi:hypothetical protein